MTRTPASAPSSCPAARLEQQPARLAALRQEMTRRGVEAFLVPHADRFQGEYLPPCEERLAWLTGFSGSAGMAVVTLDKAALFVDGRYTLQVTRESDPALYSFHHISDDPPARWLGRQLPAGSRIGFDPWLHTASGIETLATALETSGQAGSGSASGTKPALTLVPLDSNPLETLWQDRPPPPAAPARPFLPEAALPDAADKREALCRQLRDAGEDVLLVTAADSVAWLLDVRGTDVPFTPVLLAWAMLEADSGALTLVVEPSRIPPELLQAWAKAGRTTVHLCPPQDFPARLAGLAGPGGGKTVRLDRASAAFALKQQAEAAGARVVLREDPCALPRALKSPFRQQGMREAHRLDGIALCRFFTWLQQQRDQGLPVSELQASDRLEAFRREEPRCLDLSFATIAGSGPHGAIVHYRVSPDSNRLLQDGDLFLLDSGGQYLDGTTDVTRTIAIGTPTAEMRRCHTLVLKGHVALSQAVFPAGTTGHHLDTLARQFLWQDGLDYDHGTGHGVGSCLSVHEGPQRISRAPSTVPLQPGMVLSNEPGYYRKDAFGIRIENLVMVVPHPAPPPAAEREMLALETLTLVPYDRRLICLSLLTAGEISWIDALHRRIYQSLAPALAPAELEWLARQTAPLGTLAEDEA